MNADPICAGKGAVSGDVRIGGDGKSLCQRRRFFTWKTASATMSATRDGTGTDRSECRYHPRLRMRVGQPLVILNSDPTLHNIHAMPKSNTNSTPGSRFRDEDDAHLDKPE
jgi:hypothetical protein